MQIIQLLLRGRVWLGEFLKLPLALESPHDELLCMYHSTWTFYSNQHCSLKFKFVIKAEYKEESRDPNKDRPATKHRQHHVVPHNIPTAEKGR